MAIFKITGVLGESAEHHVDAGIMVAGITSAEARALYRKVLSIVAEAAAAQNRALQPARDDTEPAATPTEPSA